MKPAGTLPNDATAGWFGKGSYEYGTENVDLYVTRHIRCESDVRFNMLLRLRR